eukprot:TRINITY_DN24174_c0_g1_i1.p1 TRINITY_DN24174_c0_g1~~TRINITY_DN24174_c0_g1_i1.p1  ORF type:complete len:437 (+),score=82.28 TRINITY_DN24174_c0_g1_i1:220-1530(+)
MPVVTRRMTRSMAATPSSSQSPLPLPIRKTTATSIRDHDDSLSKAGSSDDHTLDLDSCDGLEALFRENEDLFNRDDMDNMLHNSDLDVLPEKAPLLDQIESDHQLSDHSNSKSRSSRGRSSAKRREASSKGLAAAKRRARVARDKRFQSINRGSTSKAAVTRSTAITQPASQINRQHCSTTTLSVPTAVPTLTNKSATAQQAAIAPAQPTLPFQHNTVIKTTPPTRVLIDLTCPPDEGTYESTYAGTHAQCCRFFEDNFIYTFEARLLPYRPTTEYLQQLVDRAHTRFSITQHEDSYPIRPRRIDICLNLHREEQFRAYQQSLQEAGKNASEEYVFHGSSPDRLRSIMFEGFLVGGSDVTKAHGSVYGQGIYTSRCVNDAMAYSKHARAVLLCLALPGQMFLGKKPMREDDSWVPKPHWRVFRCAEQLLPLAVITY